MGVMGDMEVTVLALPAMEVTVLDTVSGRDLLMPDTVDMDVEAMVDTAVDMEVMVDADTVDTVERDLLMPGTEVDTEDMVDTVDMLTESKFYTSINLLPFILISSHFTYSDNALFHSFHKSKNQIIFRHVHQKLRKSFEIDKKE